MELIGLSVFLLPSLFFAFLTCKLIRWSGIKGYPRLCLLALGTAMWFAPSNAFTAHGMVPVPLGIEAMFYVVGEIRGQPYGAKGFMQAGAIYALVTGALTLILGLAYRFFVPDWALRRQAPRHPPETSAS